MAGEGGTQLVLGVGQQPAAAAQPPQRHGEQRPAQAGCEPAHGASVSL